MAITRPQHLRASISQQLTVTHSTQHRMGAKRYRVIIMEFITLQQSQFQRALRLQSIRGRSLLMPQVQPIMASIAGDRT